ncbi:hypothetical protein L6452_31198 [Arctium lappa]|uniref:Uncharacterized protein n=1 Tax=Arctium lappa TaxID=4217 RepID=A0ACB8ZKQ4_ARCLA|nr:hypothetical protein L6452_31198 [Arctium lappa]
MTNNEFVSGKGDISISSNEFVSSDEYASDEDVDVLFLNQSQTLFQFIQSQSLTLFTGSNHPFAAVVETKSNHSDLIQQPYGCCLAALLLCCFAALLLCCFAALLLCCFAAGVGPGHMYNPLQLLVYP